MRIGLFTDGLAHLSLEEVIAWSAPRGIHDLELGVGGYSNAPHLELDQVHVVLRRLANDAPATRHDVLQADQRREPDPELADGAGPRPVRHGLADEAHREHPVREDTAHAGGPGELVVLVDRVEVAGRARVAGELDLLDRPLDERRELVAHLDVVEVDPGVLHSLTTVTPRMVATISFEPSAMVVSRTTNAIGPLRPVFS